jgi:ABC transporter/ABC-2 type transporter
MLRTREASPSPRGGRDRPAIEVRGLLMRYGDREVLGGIDLVVPHGMVVGFLGPNGAGKTTTVEILEGYRRRTAGQASVLGMDPARGGRELRERIGIVLQETGHNPDLTVRETVRQFAGYYRRPMQVGEVVELVGAATFTAVGVAFTRLVANADSAPGLANAAYLPLLFLSGAWFPIGGLPHWLASAADAFPLAPMLDGMRQALIFGHGPGAVWPDLRKLLAWLVVGLLVALRTFRWERAA